MLLDYAPIIRNQTGRSKKQLRVCSIWPWGAPPLPSVGTGSKPLGQRHFYRQSPAIIQSPRFESIWLTLASLTPPWLIPLAAQAHLGTQTPPDLAASAHDQTDRTPTARKLSLLCWQTFGVSPSWPGPYRPHGWQG